MNTFVQDWKNGKAQPDQIDDYIDQWHGSNSRLPLSTYLGLTPKQYAQWVAALEQLLQILKEIA